MRCCRSVSRGAARTNAKFVPNCTIANLRSAQPAAVPLWAADCGRGPLPLGEATSHVEAWYPAQSGLLVVLQRADRTEISVVTVAADGSAYVEDLTSAIERVLRLAGRAQSALLDIDLAGFAASGAISAQPVLGTAVHGAAASVAATAPLAIDLGPMISAAAARQMAIGAGAAPIVPATSRP